MMKGQAALLLVVLLATALATSTIEKVTKSTTHQTDEKSTSEQPSTATIISNPTRIKANTLEYVKPSLNPKKILLQEIRTLNEDAENEKMQEEVAKTIKAEAQKIKLTSKLPSDIKLNLSSTKINNPSEDGVLKKLLEAEDMNYNNDDLDEKDDEDEDDEDAEDEDEYNYDEDEGDDPDDEEEVMTDCPEYCGCVGQYASATTAKCTKLEDSQNFGTSISHLHVLYAGDVRLGSHALQFLGLQQLESIKFVNTRIIELDRTAFDGLNYIFSVNITRAGLLEIDPDIFQNNTQLNLLAISGNTLKQPQNGKSKEYLLNAPSVTEFDFSDNSLMRLPRMAFAKMPNLVYINLKKNKLRSLDRVTFKTLDSLAELDVSDNQLSAFPTKFFEGLELQTLRISGNNFTTLSVIDSPKLTVLEASKNKIKHIAKEDLSGVLSLDQLIVKSNGLIRIHQHAFNNLDQLTYLDISDNAITSLTEHHLRTNSRLQILLMSNNPNLESLPVFKTNAQEHEIYSVHRFECANCGLLYLEEKTFDAMPALTRLNLAKNRLTNLPKGLLEFLSSLRELDLSDNFINHLENHMFYGATSLTKLNLAGNPLAALQITPFFMTPSLLRLDVSRCVLERVWSEARLPLKNLRFLSVHGNRLKRITVEELKATPQLSGLDLTENPLMCDDDFNEAIEWLTKHEVIPKQTLNSSADYNYNYETISQWSDLAKKVCGFFSEGPPARVAPKKAHTQIPYESSPASIFGHKNTIDKMFDYELDNTEDDIIAWTSSNQDEEYEEYSMNIAYGSWYSGVLWPVMTIIFVVLAILMLVAHFAVCLSKRKRHGPVIRPPMILRQGFMDNKNCGLVYKPLQEEIATPHMPKRGSFYSSSTFHYDKIVPESV